MNLVAGTRFSVLEVCIELPRAIPRIAQYQDAVIIKEERTGVCTVTHTIHTLLVELVFTVYDSYVGSMGRARPRAKFS